MAYLEVWERDLGEYEVDYLFVDGIAACIRPSQRREPVLAESLGKDKSPYRPDRRLKGGSFASMFLVKC